MFQKYYDVENEKVLDWKELTAPSEKFPYGLGLDNDSFVASKGYYEYREERLPYDIETQELVPDQKPVFINGSYVLYYRPENFPQNVLIEKWSTQIREERDRRISATDYLMSADYPIDENIRELWTKYRQDLRDIPEQLGFPWKGPNDPECPWPVKP